MSEEHVHDPVAEEDKDPSSGSFMLNESAIEAAAAAAVAAVGDMHEAVEAALGVGVKDEDGQAEKGESRRGKRTREPSEDADEEGKPKRNVPSHSDQLAQRRQKDRQRYASMTPDQRQVYNAKRREQYHRQSETSRQRRRERERNRYHSLSNDEAKDRNSRRAKLERERYQRLSPEELEAKNRKRRERAAQARLKKTQDRNDGSLDGDSAAAPPKNTKKEAKKNQAVSKVDVEAEAAAAAAAEDAIQV